MRKIAVISVSVNVLLLLWCIKLHFATNAAHTEGTHREEETIANERDARDKNITQIAEAGNPGVEFDWSQVESADYIEYIDNLRAIGCPEQTIRDIIIADVDALFDKRKDALLNGGTGFEYWRTDRRSRTSTGLLNQGLMNEVRQLAGERRALLRRLLGVDFPNEGDWFAELNLKPEAIMLGFLAPIKRAHVLNIKNRYKGLLTDMHGGEVSTDNHAAQLNKLLRNMEAELAGVLTPEELKEYQLRMSASSGKLRLRLGAFDPTPEEFRAMFDLQKQFDLEWGVYDDGGYTNEELEARRISEAEFNNGLREVLGDDRFRELEQKSSRDYMLTEAIIRRHGLPAELAGEVWRIREIAESQVERLIAIPELERAEKLSSLRAIRSETQQAMKDLVGNQAFDDLSEAPATQWLRNIAPDQ